MVQLKARKTELAPRAKKLVSTAGFLIPPHGRKRGVIQHVPGSTTYRGSLPAHTLRQVLQQVAQIIDYQVGLHHISAGAAVAAAVAQQHHQLIPRLARTHHIAPGVITHICALVRLQTQLAGSVNEQRGVRLAPAKFRCVNFYLEQIR